MVSDFFLPSLPGVLVGVFGFVFVVFGAGVVVGVFGLVLVALGEGLVGGVFVGVFGVLGFGLAGIGWGTGLVVLGDDLVGMGFGSAFVVWGVGFVGMCCGLVGSIILAAVFVSGLSPCPDSPHPQRRAKNTGKNPFILTSSYSINRYLQS